MNPRLCRAYVRQREISHKQWVQAQAELWFLETAVSVGLIVIAVFWVWVLRGCLLHEVVS